MSESISPFGGDFFFSASFACDLHSSRKSKISHLLNHLAPLSSKRQPSSRVHSVRNPSQKSPHRHAVIVRNDNASTRTSTPPPLQASHTVHLWSMDIDKPSIALLDRKCPSVHVSTGVRSVLATIARPSGLPTRKQCDFCTGSSDAETGIGAGEFGL